MKLWNCLVKHPYIVGKLEKSLDMGELTFQKKNCMLTIAAAFGDFPKFPGPACSSLAVRNSRRGPGLVHHVMSATAYVTPISLRINDVIG